MRRLLWILSSASLVAFAGTSLYAQTSGIVKKLNERLAASCFNQPVLEVSPEGTVVRKDADGGTMTFALSDIAGVEIEFDAQAHVLLSCRAGAACIERTAPSGPASRLRILAFSINAADEGEAVRRLFEELRAAFAAPSAGRRTGSDPR